MTGYRNTSFAGGLTGGLAGTAAAMVILAPAAIYDGGGGGHAKTTFHVRHLWPNASFVMAEILVAAIAIAAVAVAMSLLFVAIMRPLERWRGGFARLSSWLAGGVLVAMLLVAALRTAMLATGGDIPLWPYAVLVISCLIGTAAAWRAAHRVIA